MKRLALCLVFLVACGSSAGSGFGGGDDAGSGGDATQSGEGGPTFSGPDANGGEASLGTDGAPAHTCNPTSDDLSGCTCPTPSATRACYTADPKTRNVGACKDGQQTCVRSGEVSTWGACTGAVGPTTESCTGMTDSNCNGKVGCADPTCATDPSCNTGCTNGQMRSCYDGPMGTENVGLCKDGTQVCANGVWPTTCTGEVLPDATENCCDAFDHNCNGLPGCFDIFSCLTNSCCQIKCDTTKVDPGCVCPTGAGDTQTCPQGDHYVLKNNNEECCPCTTNDCGTPNCCGESVCAGSSWCANMTCNPLPASCNGQVSADCDDFPEDCDEPCCECTDGC